MATSTTRHLFDDFKDKSPRFDIITDEVRKASTMKNIEEAVEKNRAEIFEILSTDESGQLLKIKARETTGSKWSHLH